MTAVTHQVTAAITPLHREPFVNFFRNLNLGARLGAGFGLTLLLLVIVTGIGLRGIARVEQAL